MGPGVTVGYAPGRGRAKLGKPRMEEVGAKGRKHHGRGAARHGKPRVGDGSA